MMSIINKLRTAIHVQHLAAVANLTESATSDRLTQATSLAERLEDKGIPAEVDGRVEGVFIHFWVNARPHSLAALERALIHLNLAEHARYIDDQSYQIRFVGIEAPLFIVIPMLTEVAQ